MITTIFLVIGIGTFIFTLSMIYLDYIAYKAKYDEEQKEDVILKGRLIESRFITQDTTPIKLGPAEFEVPDFAKAPFFDYPLKTIEDINNRFYEEKKKQTRRRKRKTSTRKQRIKGFKQVASKRIKKTKQRNSSRRTKIST